MFFHKKKMNHIEEQLHNRRHDTWNLQTEVAELREKVEVLMMSVLPKDLEIGDKVYSTGAELIEREEHAKHKLLGVTSRGKKVWLKR